LKKKLEKFLKVFQQKCQDIFNKKCTRIKKSYLLYQISLVWEISELYDFEKMKQRNTKKRVQPLFDLYILPRLKQRYSFKRKKDSQTIYKKHTKHIDFL